MAIKAIGAEVKAFYSDPVFWPDGVWHEDEIIEINGVQVEEGEINLETVQDNCIITIVDGFVTNEQGKNLGSFEGYFKKWRKLQNTVMLYVEVPKDKLYAVETAIKASGGKIKR